MIPSRQASTEWVHFIALKVFLMTKFGDKCTHIISVYIYIIILHIEEINISRNDIYQAIM